MATLDPEAHVKALIASINDGARTARASTNLLLLTALYLAVVAFSTSDEAILRDGSTKLAQIGIEFPIRAAFVAVPLVFLFIHATTLIQASLLAAKLRALNEELRRAYSDAADHDRARNLLDNLSLIQVLAGTESGRGVRVIVWLSLAAIPVFVLLVTQLSFLRYQSYLITGIHQTCLVVDFIMLLAFAWRRDGGAASFLEWRRIAVISYRRLRRGARSLDPEAARFLRFAGIRAAWAAPILVFSVVFGSVAGPNAESVGRGAMAALEVSVSVINSSCGDKQRCWFSRAKANVWAAKDHPVDMGLCPWFGLGCRYLRLANRTLLANDVAVEVIAHLDRGGPEENPVGADLDKVVGLFLRERSLRFADFAHSRFYKVDLRGADLRGANLLFTRLSRADLSWARLQGANIQGAQLQGAHLSGAEIQSADLRGVRLLGADLRQAQLQGATLVGAHLMVADLARTGLQGADLYGAQLQGASLSGAQLQGTDLRNTDLWRTRASELTVLGLLDLRHASFAALTEVEQGQVTEFLKPIPNLRPLEGGWRKSAVPEFTDNHPDASIALATVTPPLLVDDNVPVELQSWVKSGVTTNDEWEFDQALAPVLIDLGCSDGAIAQGIARRAGKLRYNEPSRTLGSALARGLLEPACTGGNELSDEVRDGLQEIVESQAP